MKETILVVDDVDYERKMLTAIMGDEFVTLEASSGEACFEMVEKYKDNIKVILLDLFMPGMDGFDVLKKREEIPWLQEIPVIVLTASGAMDDQVKAFELGANDYITKPFQTELVKSRIYNVLAAFRRMKKLKEYAEGYKLRSALDPLTGLYNKMTIEQKIGELMRRNADEKKGLLLLDIDNFTTFVAEPESRTGQRIVKLMADAMIKLFEAEPLIGRIDRDMFVVFSTGEEVEEILKAQAEELVKRLRKKPNITQPANLTISAGITFSQGNELSYKEMYEKAFKALMASKTTGKAKMTQL